MRVKATKDEEGRAGAATGLTLPPLAPPKWRRYEEEAAQAGWRSVAWRLPGLLAQAVGLAWRASPRDLLATAVFNVAAGVFTAVVLVGTAGVLEELLTAGPTTDRVLAALPALAVVGGAALMRGALSAAAGWAQARLEPQVERVSELRLAELATGVRVLAFDDNDFHDRMFRATIRGADEAKRVVTYSIDILTGLIGIIAAAGVLGILHPLLIPLLLLTVLPEGWAASLAARMRYAWILAITESRRRKGMLDDLMTSRASCAEVRSFTMRGPLLAEFDAIAGHERDVQLVLARRQALVRLAGEALGGTATLLTYVVLGLLLVNDMMPLAVAGAAVIAIRTGQSALATTLMAVNSAYESGLYFRDFLDFCDRAKAWLPPSGLAAPPDAVESITVEDVVFGYPGKDDHALDGVSLRVGRGETIALVGENGSGKTTLSKLLAGLYTPVRGRVCWDGTDLAGVDAHALRGRIAIIAQDHTHWPFSARRNVTMSSPDDPGRLDEAARVSGAREIVDELPHGWDTLLDRRFAEGQELSGGQWQRVAAARGFYRDAPLLICDEPTAALDARAEQRLFASIHEHARRTRSAVVLITHRLASVRMADRVYVLDRGRVVEEGTHDQLMSVHGLYAELYSIQAEAYRGGSGEVEESASL
ncbi:ABC transporter ATP-binding protein [Nocardiopsis ansamitocini]|uniref:Multidrug ABC transporter permease n=1 Tax=Nocardiopsis ansamitocini TaxID=1670832 RepID=A0A9W6P3P1_9ACTN|nr:ABC transporter ATP-binding protein [Nocardiopsis ansamitocini]GLU46524.1 multidrug ABC transporter permease [Nocardiopsis ansamitocini]